MAEDQSTTQLICQECGQAIKGDPDTSMFCGMCGELTPLGKESGKKRPLSKELNDRIAYLKTIPNTDKDPDDDDYFPPVVRWYFIFRYGWAILFMILIGVVFFFAF